MAGIALLALALGAIAWVELATLGGRLERTPGPTRLEESDPYPLRLGLRRTLVPPPGGELSDPLLDRPIPVGPRWRRGASRDIWLERPGRMALVPARLVVRDPLGLWRRELDSGRTAELVVLPRIDPVRWIGPGSEPRGIAAGSGSDADATSRRGGLAQFEVDGLRPYREGSPASRIHWPAVARTGEMIERRLIAGGEPRPLVVFDPRGSSGRDLRERAMRAAASLCVELAQSGGCELLVPGERRPLAIDPSLRTWPEAHTQDRRLRPGRRADHAGGPHRLRRPLGDPGQGPALLAAPPAARQLPDHPEGLATRGGLPGLGLLGLSGDGAGRALDLPAQGGRMTALAGDRSARVELACFAALAALAALQWTSLVAHPPAGRVVVAVLFVTAAGAAIAAIARLELSRAARLALAAVATVAGICFGMVVVGLPARLLLPGHWDELRRQSVAEPRRGRRRPCPLLRRRRLDAPGDPAGEPARGRAGRLRRLLADPPPGGRTDLRAGPAGGALSDRASPGPGRAASWPAASSSPS